MTIDAFPLQWPAHVRRYDGVRAFGGFQVTPDTATRELIAEVRRSGGTGLVISTNRPVRRDGLPMQGAKEPADPGVAVYFTRKGQNICIPCDTFDRVWKNIRAIGLSIKDMRGPESRGCAAITDQAFTGFAALPAPGAAHWSTILGVPRSATSEDVQLAYKAKARALGAAGNDAARAELNAARDRALEDIEGAA
jgi:hypothetical protein